MDTNSHLDPATESTYGSAHAKLLGNSESVYHKAFKTPEETLNALTVVAQKKASLGLDKLAVLSFLAGAYIAFGGLGSLSITGGITSLDKGVVRLLFAGIFPVGLMLVIIAGADLFTGNVMTMTIGLFARKVSIVSLLRSWVVSFVFNFLGAACVAYLLCYQTNILLASPWQSFVQNYTVTKINQPFGVQIMRGVGCNVLVCLAVWMATAAEDIVSKVFAIYFPIMLFVAIGFEHSVANMFFLPAGLMYGASSDFGTALWKNLLPVTIGNTIGGLLVALCYLFAYHFARPAQWISSFQNAFAREILFGVEVPHTD